MFNSFVIPCVHFIKQPASQSLLLHPAFHQRTNILMELLWLCRNQKTKNQITVIQFDKSNHCNFFFSFDHSRFMFLIYPCSHAHPQDKYVNILFCDYSKAIRFFTITNSYVQFCVSGDVMGALQMIFLSVIKYVMPVCLFLVG